MKRPSTVILFLALPLSFIACKEPATGPDFTAGVEAGYLWPQAGKTSLDGKPRKLQIGMPHAFAEAWLGPPTSTGIVASLDNLTPMSLADVPPGSGISLELSVYDWGSEELRIVYGPDRLALGETGDRVFLYLDESPCAATEWTIKRPYDAKSGQLHLAPYPDEQTPLDPWRGRVRYSIIRGTETVLSGFSVRWIFVPSRRDGEEPRSFLTPEVVTSGDGKSVHRSIQLLVLPDGSRPTEVEIP